MRALARCRADRTVPPQRRPWLPDFLVRMSLGVVAFGIEQQPRRLAAARDFELAPGIAQPLVHRVDRKAKVQRRGLGVVPPHDQAERLLFLFGECLKLSALASRRTSQPKILVK